MFVSDAEVEKVVNSIKSQKIDDFNYDESIIKNIEETVESNDVEDEEVDELFYDAVKIVLEKKFSLYIFITKKNENWVCKSQANNWWNGKQRNCWESWRK